MQRLVTIAFERAIKLTTPDILILTGLQTSLIIFLESMLYLLISLGLIGMMYAANQSKLVNRKVLRSAPTLVLLALNLSSLFTLVMATFNG